MKKRLIPIRLLKDLDTQVKHHSKNASEFFSCAARSFLEQNAALYYQERRLQRLELKEEFNREFPMIMTSLMVSDDLLEAFKLVFKDTKQAVVIHNIIYFGIKEQNPSYSNNYFNEEYFVKKYNYSESAYREALSKIYKDIKRIPTTREYEEFKEEKDPSLYHIRKKYNSFQNFINIYSDF